MAGAPPFAAENLVTLANWQDPPYNRWAFQHVRELLPTARIARGDGPVWALPRAERDDLDDLRFDVERSQLAPRGTLTVRELLDRTYTDGFLVIHQGQIVAERYFNGPGAHPTARRRSARATAPGTATRTARSTATAGG